MQYVISNLNTNEEKELKKVFEFLQFERRVAPSISWCRERRTNRLPAALDVAARCQTSLGDIFMGKKRRFRQKRNGF